MVLGIAPDSHPELLPYVLIVMSQICAICLLMARLVIIPARKRAFTPEVMAKFKDQHFRDFNEDVPPIGFPDMGSGLYSQEVPYK